MKKLLFCLLFTCVLLCVFTAVQAESVSLYLNRDSLTLSVGRYVTVYAHVSPEGAMRDDVTFSTSDSSVASVSKDGKVRALKAGECELTATSRVDETISVTIPVRVIVPVENVDIVAAENALIIGATLQLSVEIEPADATIQSVTYSSSNENVATVSENGLVTGLSRGEVTIMAESGDGRTKGSMLVTVKQPPESVTVSPETVTVAEGRTERLKPTVLPRNTNDKTVLWTSADESVATVSDRGVVTGVQLGETVITATCKDNVNATFTVPVTVLRLATSVAFDQDSYDILVGDTIQLYHTVYPLDTSDQSVTYKVRNSRIASVDENGLLTAKKGGRTTVTVTTADGSRKSGTATVNVIVPVTGVYYSRSDIRVGDGNYGHFTVKLEPSDATNHNMTWVTADPNIATVTGDSTTFKIIGRNWGRTTVTGTTEDGGYTVTINVNIGSLYRAVSVESLSIRNGKPYITLRNNSNMVITQVRYFMQGLDANQQPINMSTTGDLLTLYGTYDLPLYPGDWTEHGRFTFYAHSDYPNLTYLFLVVTGWSTPTGYFDSNGYVRYEFNIPESYQILNVYPPGSDLGLYQSNG